MSTYDEASLIMIPSGVKDGKVYSAKPTNGDGDMTFTRASEASRVNSAGLVEKVRTNSILQSNDFDTTWAAAATITGGQADKDGGTSAWVVASTAIGSETRMRQSHTFTVGQVIALSCYMKAGTVNFGIVRTYAITGGGRVWFDLLNGTVGTENSGLTGSIESVGSGWYRCSITGVIDTTGAIDIAPAPSDGDYLADAVGETIYIQDSQLELGTAATDYIATTTVAVSEGPVANLPRLDYSGGATCPSLLLEPSRTNLWPSEYITSLLSSGATVDYNSTTSPDGYLNAMRLNSITSHSRVQLNNGTITGGYTGSVYVKSAGDYATLRLRLNTTGDQVQFNINTDGTVTRLTGDADYTITDAGNGWHRVTALFTAVGDSSNYFQIYADSSDGGSSVYIYGIQFELGNYSTSLISTYGTAATRVADACSKTGVSSLIGQTEGTIFVDFTFDSITSENRQIFQLSDGSTNNLHFRIRNSNDLQSYGTGNFAPFDERLALTADGRYKMALGYSNGDFAYYVNGVQIATDTQSTTASNLSEIYLGINDLSSTPLGGVIQEALLFTTRLTNAELETLTTL